MDEVFQAFDIAPVTQTETDALPSCFAVTDLAALSMGAVGAALANLIQARGLAARPQVSVDRRLASLWFGWSIHPQGWDLGWDWDPVAGDYLARDGWIRLHTNAPHHRAAALRVLECPADRDTVAQAIRRWEIDALESAIVAAGGAAAAMRDRAAWLAHPQGAAVASEPLVQWSHRPGALRDHGGTLARPLQGLRVLDLTRVLAGPIGTRTLAGFGAEVLRIDPPAWDEPGVIPEVTLGKRCARLDLKSATGVQTLRRLIAGADVLVHGYRPGALDAILPQSERQALAPNLIEVCHNAYGWTGPWAGRRGFDSLLQMSSGIAQAGMQWKGADNPTPLPVQALDHATGYFIAASVITALTRAAQGRGLYSARLSLARTAELLATMPGDDSGTLGGSSPTDLNHQLEHTSWGPARRLSPAITIPGTPMTWTQGATTLGAHDPHWT